MRTVIRCLIMAVMGALSVSTKAYEAMASTVLHAHVLAVSDFPAAGSGILKTWISVEVAEDETSARQELLLVYLSDEEVVPKVGEESTSPQI